MTPALSDNEIKTHDSDYGDFLAFIKDEDAVVPVLTPTDSHDETSSSDNSDFAGFATFLKTPSQKDVSPKEQLAQVRASVSERRRSEKATRARSPNAESSHLTKGAAVGLTKQMTTQTTIEYASSESSWSEDPTTVRRAPASQAPAFKAATTSRSAPAPASKPVPAPVSKPPTRAQLAIAAKKAEKEKEYELPQTASLSVQHFQRGEAEKAEKAKAARSQTKVKEAEEPLPFDHFTKQGDAEMEEKAKAQWDRAEAQMSVGARYFTAKGEEDKLLAIAEQKKNSELNMSMATRHFSKKAAEKEANAKEEDLGVMPAAIQHFTVKDRAIKDKKKAEIQAMHDTPHDMAPGQSYFTKQMRADKEKKAAEIEEMKKNPAAASLAGQHFAKINEKKKVEMEESLKQPASVATEYFNNKAEDERKKSERAAKNANETAHVASLATQHFQKIDEDKASQREAAARSLTTKEESVEPLPVDYFTKQGDAEMEDKAKEQWDRAEAQMSVGARYFTAKGEEDKLLAIAEQKKNSELNMSMATRHFSKKAAEKEANTQVQKVDNMPLAIQHFTVKDRKVKDKKKAEIQAMHDTPHDMAPGQAYFTNQSNAEKEKKTAEIEELKKNPPAASMAGQHFAKINKKKKVEMKELVNAPASVAGEYFNKKAQDEKRSRSSASAGETPHVASLATRHFDDLEKQKAQAVEEARKKTLEKKRAAPSKPRASVDWTAVTKQKAPGVPKYYTGSAGPVARQ